MLVNVATWMPATAPWGGGNQWMLLVLELGAAAFATAAAVVLVVAFYWLVARACRLLGRPLLAVAVQRSWPLLLTPFALLIEVPESMLATSYASVPSSPFAVFGGTFWILGCVAGAYALTRRSLRRRESDGPDDDLYERTRSLAVRIATFVYGSLAVIAIAIGTWLGVVDHRSRTDAAAERQFQETRVRTISPERPERLSFDTKLTAELEVGEDVLAGQQSGVPPQLTLGVQVSGFRGGRGLIVKLNGVELSNSELNEDWLEYAVRPEWVREGSNDIEITLRDESVGEPEVSDLRLRSASGR